MHWGSRKAKYGFWDEKSHGNCGPLIFLRTKSIKEIFLRTVISDRESMNKIGSDRNFSDSYFSQCEKFRI